MTKTVVFLNGPPGSGKDTIAKIIVDACNSRPFLNLDQKPNPKDVHIQKHVKGSATIVKYAQPLRTAAIGAFNHLNLDEDNFDKHKSSKIYEDNELTLRQWMIKYSEEFMKPIFGKDIFGKIAYSEIKEKLNVHDNIFITDSGFAEETSFIVKSLNEEYDGCIKFVLVHLSREGFSFKNDSRSYIDVPEISKDQIYEIENKGTIDDFCNEFIKIIF